MTTTTSRRDFVRASAIAGGGFMLAFHIPASDKLAGAAGALANLAEPFAPNAWIRIATDGTITFVVDRSEMGQGINTALSMLLAEELDADWTKVRNVHAPADPVYNNRAFGMQITGGSSSIPGSWKHFREAGAAAREMLVAAAAQEWGVDASSCTTANSVVTHSATGRTLSYGELSDRAATMPVPKEPKVKDAADYKVIGKAKKRLDTPAKVNGTAQYGIDVNLPGMLIAVVARTPAFGAKVTRVDSAKALAIPGVKKVVEVSNGVAVIADGYWAAKKGRDALVVTWDRGPNAANSTATISKQMRDAAKQPGAVARHEGQGADGLKGAVRVIEAEFEVPFQAHVTMEPMNATADVRADGCDVYAPTQWQDNARGVAARATGLDPSKVQIHTTFLGGGFGRKAEQDFIQDAVEASKAMGAPVKVIYSREDDIKHDFYRTAAYGKLSAGVDADGWPVAWTNSVSGATSVGRHFPAMIVNGLDTDLVAGSADVPYAIPNIHVECHVLDLGVPVGFWRGIGNTQGAFFTECFIDELAWAAKKDPVEYRRKLLADKPRHLGVLNLATEKAKWGSPLPAGRFRGVAVHDFAGTLVCHVAEISLQGASVRVHKMVTAVDCGQVINPDTVVAQMESGIVYGLSSCIKGAITIERGGVKQNNFDDYPLLRLREMPVVETYIVPSTATPTGVGEPPVPPVAPAVANAVRAATGIPVRSLPIRIAPLIQAGRKKP